jgi:hypothetical protein
MSRTFWTTTIWTWLLWLCVPLTAIMGFGVAFYFGLLVLYDNVPQALYQPVGGFIAAFLVVVFGSLTAPMHRAPTAAIIFLIGAFIAWQMVSWTDPVTQQPTVLPIVGTYIGGVLAVLLIGWRFSWHKIKRYPTSAHSICSK